jgi:pimeloyl-ACP methyl ester carboxylesterase
LAEFVTIEKGLGPEGRIAVVRFDSGDGINALSPEALRQLTNAARSFEDDGDTTLVLHCRDDAAMPFEQGRLIASRIPRARLVQLESRNHILLPRDPAWIAFVSEVRRFLREGAPTMSRA